MLASIFSPRRLGLVALLTLIGISAIALAAENTVERRVRYSQFSTDGGTKSITIWTSDSDVLINRVVMRRDTMFASRPDGSVANVTLSVGKSGDTTKYQAASEVIDGGTGYANGSVITTGPGYEARNTAITITMITTLDDGGVVNTSNLTQGQATFIFYVSTLPRAP